MDDDDDDDEELYEYIEEEIEVEVDEDEYNQHLQNININNNNIIQINHEQNIEESEEEKDNNVIKIQSPASPDVSRVLESNKHGEHLISDPFGPVIRSTGESKFSIASEAKNEASVYVHDPISLKLGTRQGSSDDLESVGDKKDSVASVEMESLCTKAFLDHDCVTVESSVVHGEPVAAALSAEGGSVEETNSVEDVEANNKNSQELCREDRNLTLTRSGFVDANNANVFFDHGCVTAEPSDFFGEEVYVAISTKDGYAEETNGIEIVEADFKNAGGQSGEDISLALKSPVLPQARPRNLSPLTELNATNKRPAAICNFFAKGWCIKGNSCKFLHVKDHASITNQKPEGDEGKIKSQTEIGLGHSTERSDTVGSPIATISPVPIERSQSQDIRENHHFKERHEILPRQQEGSSHAHNDSSTSNSSFRDFGGDNLRLNSVEVNSISKSRPVSDTYSTFSLSTSINRALPSFNSSTWTRGSYSIGSVDKDRLHALGSTTLLRTTSPFSGSDSKNHSLKDFSMDPRPIASRRTKISSADWELSVPFRPSFPYTQNLLSSFTLYDPIRDGIEQSMTSDLSPKIHHSLSDKDFSNRILLSTEGETIGNCDDEQNSGNNLHKEGNPLRFDEQTSESNVRKEEKPSRRILGKDRAEAYNGNHGSIPRLQKNGTNLKEIEMDRDRQKIELNLGNGRDEAQRDSKAMKMFRVALIDFVKELVKPSWHDGRLSKDAHKVVVKNAVEKVLSTVQPHEAPSTEESIKQYLSISESKMGKLVEAYVVKYGKS